nr:hypothetical protein [Moraxella catarrhalis]
MKQAASVLSLVRCGGDYQVDDPNALTQAQKDKLISQAKMIAGITAAFADTDVAVAAGVVA